MGVLRPEIVNVVMSAWAGKLDIEKLARTLPKSMYEPDSFAGLIYHRQAPKATIIMFSTGRIVSTGAKSVKQSTESLNVTLFELAEIVKSELKIKNKKTENIVIKCDLGNGVNLKKLAKKDRGSKYNPDLFPAIIYTDKPNPSCLVFGSGKIISAGSKTETQAHKTIRDVHTRIRKLNCFLDYQDMKK